MQNVVMFSIDDYKAILSILHDLKIDIEWFNDGYTKSECNRKINEIIDLLKGVK